MVRLENVNKYFNRKKKNEIHVINDTTLEFAESGLVCLLGPSGCGKTTLLNAIGGLDRIQKGKIFINGQRITGRRSGRIDEIRNVNIGYIFQNYNLVDSMTVFDNVAMVLKMIGVSSKAEIRAKVNYALDMVGMERYRNRYADMLSGGERQRVGIARAIVKNPAIIIADEPTGNLDSKNTLEVMNIIKTISRDRLVILVTHEDKLASFYASRIIRLRDGAVIADEKNEMADNLDYRIENKIYLKDIEKHERIETKDGDIDIYNDSDTKVDLEIVLKNGNIYLRNRDDMTRPEIIDENSGIEFIDGHYREMTRDDFYRHRFQPKKLAYRKPPKYSSIISFGEMIRSGFKKISEYRAVKKVLLVGFFLSAMFIMYALCNIAGVMQIQDSKFINENRDYIKVADKNINVKDFRQIEGLDAVKYAIPGSSIVNFTVPYDEYYQTNGEKGTLAGSLTSLDNISSSDLTAGRMPRNRQEVVVDRLAIERMQEDGTAKQAGLGSVKGFIGKTIQVEGTDDFTVVGITDKEEPCVYTDPSLFIELVAGGLDADQAETLNSGGSMSDITSSETADGSKDAGDAADMKLIDYNNYNFQGGTKPAKDYEAVVNETNKGSMPVGKTIDKKVNGHKLKVVGYYRDSGSSTFMLVNTNTLKYSVIEGKSGVTVYAKDMQTASDELKSMGFNVENTYYQARTKYHDSKMKSIRSSLITAGIILLISLIEIFLIMRASFLSRVKEAGVYRAIGVKKRDIYKMFLGEIIAITICAGLPGYAFMSYIVSKLMHMEYLKDSFLINPGIMLLGLAVIFALNIVFGLIPVFRTLRKTPAEILSRTDID